MPILQALGGKGSPPAVIAYQTQASNMANTSTYTFTSLALGAAATGRRVVVAYGAMMSGTSFNISGITVAGVAATVYPGGTLSDPTTYRSGFAVVNLDSGTTGNVVVTMSGGNAFHMFVAVWAVYELQSSVPTIVGVANAYDYPTANGAISTQPGGAVLAYKYDSGGIGTRSHTWTGITEVFDNTASEGYHSGAHAVSLAGGTVNISVTRTMSANNSVLSIAAFR